MREGTSGKACAQEVKHELKRLRSESERKHACIHEREAKHMRAREAKHMKGKAHTKGTLCQREATCT